MGGPNKEELDAIEAINIDKQVLEDTTPEALNELVEDVKSEVTSDINKEPITWCEAASNLDGSSGSDYSELNNADKLLNTPSPYLGCNKDK